MIIWIISIIISVYLLTLLQYSVPHSGRCVRQKVAWLSRLGTMRRSRGNRRTLLSIYLCVWPYSTD